MPSNRPDRAEAVDAYQSDSGVGANPNDSVSLAIARSGAPSGNRSSTANPAIAMSLARGAKAFQQRVALRCIDALGAPEMPHIVAVAHERRGRELHRRPGRRRETRCDFGKPGRQRQGSNEKAEPQGRGQRLAEGSDVNDTPGAIERGKRRRCPALAAEARSDNHPRSPTPLPERPSRAGVNAAPATMWIRAAPAAPALRQPARHRVHGSGRNRHRCHPHQPGSARATILRAPGRAA